MNCLALALRFVGHISLLIQSNISQFSNCAFWCFAELVEFSCLSQIVNDRFGLVSSSQLVHLSIFNYCICWDSLDSEINLEWILLLRNRFPCAPLGALVLLRCSFPCAPQCVLLALLLLKFLDIFENYLRSWPGRGESSIQSSVSFLGYRFVDGSRPALNREQWWREILSAKTAVPFLVLGLNWSSRRRRDKVPTCRDNVLFSASISRRWVLLRLDCPRTGQEVWWRWFVVPLCSLFLQLSVLTWGLKWHHKGILDETGILLISME